jgi:hypothetical protein
MRSHGDLAGLVRFLARDDWKSSFEEVLGEHFGPAMQEFDLEYEAIGAALGGGWDMTLWGVAFEDFLGRQFEPDGRNFVDEYLRRRGWNESAPTKTYMRGLRNSIMSLYEASAIIPGQSFLARDLVRGGDPVLISERTATRTLKEWDRIAARIVVQGQKRILAGGVLAFSFEGSERLMANLQEAAQSLRSGRSAPSVNKPLITDDTLREMTPLFTSTWLLDVLPKTLGLSRPTLHNSDGDEVVFHEVRFPLASKTTPNEIGESLTAISSLRRENEAFWNWLDEPAATQSPKPKEDAENVLGWNVTMEDGRTVLGSIEIKARALIVSVNSAARAERAIGMLRAALGERVAAPLRQIQTVEQMMAAQQRDRPPSTSEVPPEIQTKLIHATLDKQYRALLEQPVPMLGNLTPRAAARTKSGREKLAVWLKHLENRSRQPEATDPMATYDFAWLWRELKVENLRR